MMGDILLLNLSLSCLLRDKYKSALSLIHRVRDTDEMLLSLSKWVRDNEGVGREGRSVGGVEVDDVGDGLLADGAESGGGVGAHAAVFRAAPDALALVAAALIEAYALDRAASGAGGAAGTPVASRAAVGGG